MHLLGFQLRAIKLEWKFALWNLRIVFLQKTKPVHAASKRKYTTESREVQKIRVCFHEWRKAEQRRFDTRISETNEVLRELYRFVSHQSCRFLNRPLFQSNLWSWILGNDKKNTIPSASSSNVFCEEFTVWQSRDLSYFGSGACVQNVPGKICESSPVDSPTGKWPRDQLRTRCSDYISHLARSCLCVEPAELSEIAVDRKVFRDPGMLSSRLSSEEKQAWKWMKRSFLHEVINILT